MDVSFALPKNLVNELFNALKERRGRKFNRPIQLKGPDGRVFIWRVTGAAWITPSRTMFAIEMSSSTEHTGVLRMAALFTDEPLENIRLVTP